MLRYSSAAKGGICGIAAFVRACWHVLTQPQYSGARLNGIDQIGLKGKLSFPELIESAELAPMELSVLTSKGKIAW